MRISDWSSDVCSSDLLRRGERIEQFETIRLGKNGERIDISLTVSPVHDKTGKVIGASKVARDIRERKRAEELQQLLIGELTQRIKNRSDERRVGKECVSTCR